MGKYRVLLRVLVFLNATVLEALEGNVPSSLPFSPHLMCLASWLPFVFYASLNWISFSLANERFVNKISSYLTGIPHPSQCRALGSDTIEHFYLSSWGTSDIAPKRLIHEFPVLPPQ